MSGTKILDVQNIQSTSYTVPAGGLILATQSSYPSVSFAVSSALHTLTLETGASTTGESSSSSAGDTKTYTTSTHSAASKSSGASINSNYKLRVLLSIILLGSLLNINI